MIDFWLVLFWFMLLMSCVTVVFLVAVAWLMIRSDRRYVAMKAAADERRQS